MCRAVICYPIGSSDVADSAANAKKRAMTSLMPGLATSGSASLLSASGQIASSSRRENSDRRELVVVVERDRAFHRQVRQPHLRLLQLDGAALANEECVARGGRKRTKSSQESDGSTVRSSPDFPLALASASEPTCAISILQK